MSVASTHRRLLLAVLAGVLMLSAGETPRPTQALVAPTCTVGDTLTRYRTTSDWYRTILDTRFRLSGAVRAPRPGPRLASGCVRGRPDPTHRAERLRRDGPRGADGASTVRRRVRIPELRHADLDVPPLGAHQGYRRALLASARPGHSEHQLGTAVDLKTPGGAAPWAYANWGRSRAGAWLARNSWRYGWVLSYPKGKSPGLTCYKYEPWHFRYVGRVVAARIHASGLTSREWLWRSGATGTWTGGSPVATPSPTPSPTPAVRRRRPSRRQARPRARRPPCADAEADAHAHGQADCHAHGQADCHAHGQADCRAHGQADCHADCHADAEPDAHGAADAEPDAESDAHGAADAEPDTGSDTDPCACGRAHADSRDRDALTARRSRPGMVARRPSASGRTASRAAARSPSPRGSAGSATPRRACTRCTRRG